MRDWLKSYKVYSYCLGGCLVYTGALYQVMRFIGFGY